MRRGGRDAVTGVEAPRGAGDKKTAETSEGSADWVCANKVAEAASGGGVVWPAAL
jgi:hypothetical protein